MIPTVRAFIAGNSGSGKTTYAETLYISRFPRRIILDQTGEWYGRCDVYTSTLGNFVDTLRRIAPRKRWTVSYDLSDDCFPELVHWLVPVPNLSESPASIVGGCVLLVDEVDLVAPFGPPPEYIRSLYRRSRHCGLSVVSLTQAPSNVCKEVTRQSQHRIALFLDEPADIAYMCDAMRWQLEERNHWLNWCRRYPHGAVWKETQTGKLLLLSEAQTLPVSWDASVSRLSAVPAKPIRQAVRAVPADEQAPVSLTPETPPPRQRQEPQRQQG